MEEIVAEPVLLLTACVNPAGMPFTVLQDKKLREDQYVEALTWYLRHTYCKIVFVENTMRDLSSLFEDYISSGRLEMLTFDGNNFDRTKGKGLGEALIIEYALHNSTLIRGVDNLLLIKVTGRLICENIGKIIKKCRKKDSVYVTFVPGEDECFSQIVVAPVLFWQAYFLPGKEEINDTRGFFFEHLLYNKVILWKADNHNLFQIPYYLRLRGFRGSEGTRIKQSIYGYLLFKVHYVVRYWNLYLHF